MDLLIRVTETFKSLRVSYTTLLPSFFFFFFLIHAQETRLSGLRPPTEFFDYHRISRPADLNQATSVSEFRIFFKNWYTQINVFF